MDLIGIAVGHTYIFLKDILPQTHGYNFLKTPEFIKKLVIDLINRGSGGGRPAA